MEKDIIKKINEKCHCDQGIFFQPYGIPVSIKEHVIYTRYETGGFSGGSCLGGEVYSYDCKEPEDKFKFLDLVLEELYPEIKYLEYKKIDELIHSNSETDREYYVNSTDWVCEYIILRELE